MTRTLTGYTERLPSVRFRLVWRWNPGRARQLMRERRLENVDLVAGYVEDMKALYDAAHAGILPALEADSFKPCPHSGLHSTPSAKPCRTALQTTTATESTPTAHWNASSRRAASSSATASCTHRCCSSTGLLQPGVLL